MIENNPKLCHMDEVNWRDLFSSHSNVPVRLSGNANPSTCINQINSFFILIDLNKVEFSKVLNACRPVATWTQRRHSITKRKLKNAAVGFRTDVKTVNIPFLKLQRMNHNLNYLCQWQELNVTVSVTARVVSDRAQTTAVILNAWEDALVALKKTALRAPSWEWRRRANVLTRVREFKSLIQPATIWPSIRMALISTESRALIFVLVSPKIFSIWLVLNDFSCKEIYYALFNLHSSKGSKMNYVLTRAVKWLIIFAKNRKILTWTK